MADGINGLSGYGIGNSYYSQPKGQNKADDKKDTNNPSVSVEHKEVNPDEVYAFLSANNFIIKTETQSTGYVTDPATETRVAESMKDFEFVYGLIVNEFGEDNAADIMDLVMDKLLGIA